MGRGGGRGGLGKEDGGIRKGVRWGQEKRSGVGKQKKKE